VRKRVAFIAKIVQDIRQTCERREALGRMTMTLNEGGASEERIRALALPLWESAARPYGVALDFWLMAEQMVLEMMTASARMQAKATSEVPAAVAGVLPEAVPVSRIAELAECMWEAAGRQYGMAQDFWLAAERHVLAMVRAASVPPASPLAGWAGELASLPPKPYLDRIRQLAFYLWEAAGRQYGNALDYWLKAEQEVLETMATVARVAEAAAASPAATPRGTTGADAAATVAAAPVKVRAVRRPAVKRKT
jgi:hypothetical protein